jgi:enterochelin esterase-like enzyme
MATAVACMALAIVAGCGPTSGSPPVGRSGQVMEMAVQSAALGRSMPVLIFQPRGFDSTRPFALLYLFHGYGADESAWFDGPNSDGVHVDAIAQGLIDSGRICPVVIASAYIANSYGVDSAPATDQFDHGPYARYLAEELLPRVESEVGFDAGAKARFVGGLSMGGFAALHLALTRPESFGGVAALSPAAFVRTPADRQWLFHGDPAANDPMLLATTAKVAGLKVFLGYGRSDYGWVRDGTAELGQRLSKRAADASPLVVPGGHDAGTWRLLAGPMLEALLGPTCAAEH